MHVVRLILLLCAMLMTGTVPAVAQTHIRTALVAETQRPAAGSTVTLAFDMRPDPGWHGYWANPGDAGLGMTVDWTLPPGAQAGTLDHPVPHTLIVQGMMNHVYEGPYAILTSLRIPAGLAPGTKLPIRAKADWLACTDAICVPEKGEFTLELVVGDGRIGAADRARFDARRAALPSPLAIPGTFARAGATIRLEVPYPAAAPVIDPHFFALTDGATVHAAPQRMLRDGDRLIVETEAGKAVGAEISGVLRTGPDQGLALTFRPGIVAAGGSDLSASGGWGIALTAFFGALLGGLLLNIMPCVFPILSLKALSLARAGGNARAARIEGWGYTLGAVVMALALGGVLLALRAAGEQVGWAFQLQDPLVVALLLLLALAMTLNLLGLFELPMLGGGARSGGFFGSFGTGALAAFVATPCAGPFMAAAIGTAILLPWPAALAIFAGLGLGLALPFLLIGTVPAIRKRLPRPGPWLGRFRIVMAVPMGLTTLALVWLLWRSAGVPALLLAISAALLLAIGLFLTGKRQRAGRSGWALGLAGAALAVAAVALTPQMAEQRGAAAAPAGAEPFSEARLAELRRQDKPVFLYFTADWCLTCKVNEAAAIDRADTAKAFRDVGVVIMVGDWTRRDAAIGRFLSARGRSGIPLYLYYAPGTAAPQELPQILTPALLAETVKR